MGFFIVIAFWITAVIYYHNSVWHPKWFIGLSLCALGIAWAFAKKFHWSVALALVVPVLSALWLSESRLHQYVHLTGVDQVAIRELAARGGLTLLILSITLYLAKAQHYIILEKTLGWFCIINSSVVLYQFFMGYPAFTRGGLLGNASMNGCAVAFTLPFYLWRNKKEWFPLFRPFWEDALKFFLYAAPFLALWVTESNLARMAGAVVVGAFIWSKYKLRVFPILAILAVTFPTVYFHHNHTIQALTSGRWRVWQGVMGYFWERGSILTGSGTGSAQALIPYIQGRTNMDTAGHIYLWLHSEPLQIIFEQGAIGFIAVLIMTIYALRFSYCDPVLFSALTTYIYTAFFNYPFRMAVHAFIGAFLVAASFMYNKDSQGGIWRGRISRLLIIPKMPW